jgi:hypothetical protein
VVRDDDFEACAEKLVARGFRVTTPKRGLHPDLLARLPNPEEVIAAINADYAALDEAATVFNYVEPKDEQVFLIPNSFACLPLESTESDHSERSFDVHGNTHQPLERALVESFVKCALLSDQLSTSVWRRSLMTSVWTMIRYLDIENDILDHCTDTRAVELFSEHFGRGHDARYGPKDLRISKRIGSGRELPIDSRGRPIT